MKNKTEVNQIQIRVSGDPTEVAETVEKIRSAESDGGAVTSVSKPYPCRDGGVRIYVTITK